MTAAVLTFGFDRFDLAQIVLAVLLVPASLEAFLGFCVGCQIFGRLMRAGVIPEDVCEACNDIWSRSARARSLASATWSGTTVLTAHLGPQDIDGGSGTPPGIRSGHGRR